MLSFQQKDGSFNGPLTQLDILEHTAEISHADGEILKSAQRIDDFLVFFGSVKLDDASLNDS